MTQQQTTVRIAVTFYKPERCNWRTDAYQLAAAAAGGEMTIEQQTSASASFVASAPVSIDIAALNVDIGSSGSRRSDIDDPVSLGTVNRGVSWQGLPAAGEALFDSGLLSDADRRAHRLFRRQRGERYRP